jgi:hypothetical protein
MFYVTRYPPMAEKSEISQVSVDITRAKSNVTSEVDGNPENFANKRNGRGMFSPSYRLN